MTGMALIRKGPLDGHRVIELAGIGPAPFAAMVLADLGADVLRIDRVSSLNLPAGRTDVLLRNRRSVAIDLKNPAGRDTLLRLAAHADALIEGWRPGVAERLGIGPEDCMARNRRLVYGRMTGWGQEGPLAQTAGHDIDYIALSGVLHAMGRAGGPPLPPINLVGDFGGGGMLLAVGILAGLLSAGRTGEGQVVDAAMIDGSALLMSMCHGLMAAGMWTDVRGANLLDTGAPFYDVYETADGRHVAVGALETQFYADLLRLLGLEDAGLPAQVDVSGWPQIRAAFAATFATRTRDEWARVFEGSDASVAPVLTTAEAAAHPHNAERGTLVEAGGVLQTAPAPRFSGTPTTLRRPPALPGEHTREALVDWGLAGAEVDALLQAGAVADRSAQAAPARSQ
jgi:alpha-methylacyl-CoA racemase